MQDVEAIDDLTPFATWKRYPGLNMEIQDSQLDDFFKLAEKVKNLTIQEISKLI